MEIVFAGERYKIETDEKGIQSLIRYNAQFQRWIHLRFVGPTEDNLQSVFDVLQKQYIDEFISNFK